MKTANLHLRLDSNAKSAAGELFSALGLNLRAAMQGVRDLAVGKVKAETFSTVESFMADLGLLVHSFVYTTKVKREYVG